MKKESIKKPYRSGYRGDPNAYRPFKCDLCDKAFRRRFTLQEHKKIHTGEKPFRCTFVGCSARFSTSGNLSRHRKVHLSNRYRCTVRDCGQSFCTHAALMKHVKTHSEDPPFTCPVLTCSKTFPTPTALVRHTKSHRVSEICPMSLDDNNSKTQRNQKQQQRHQRQHINLERSSAIRFPQIPRLHALPNIEVATHNPTPDQFLHSSTSRTSNNDYNLFCPSFYSGCPSPVQQVYSDFPSPLSSSLRNILSGTIHQQYPLVIPPAPATNPMTDQRREKLQNTPATTEIKAVLDNLLFDSEYESLERRNTSNHRNTVDSTSIASSTSCHSSNSSPNRLMGHNTFGSPYFNFELEANQSEKLSSVDTNMVEHVPTTQSKINSARVA